MSRRTLEDVEVSMDETSMTILGDTITYQPVMGSPVTIKAYVDHEEVITGGDGARAVEQATTVQVLMTDVPVRPSSQCRVRVRKIPGLIFRPVNVRRERGGRHWEFELERVNV